MRLLSGTALVLVLVLVLAACGGAETGPGAEPEPRLYEAQATVLEEEAGAPMLCLGAIAESLPPQCGDVPLSGWDWDAVEGEERHGGTTWGVYRVVGRYDGDTFDVVEAEPASAQSDTFPSVDLSTPCSEPAGGWPVPDPERSSYEDAREAAAYAAAQPDFAGSWLTQLAEPDEARARPEDELPVVFNAVFTGDAERHEAEIRTVWAGPLCVVERDVPTRRELTRIREEVESSLDELGLRMLWSDASEVTHSVHVGVVADPGGEAQAELDERHGAGVVRLFPALTPVE